MPGCHPRIPIAAEHDDITAVPEQQALAARLRDAELVVIPQVGHLVHYETPDVAAAAVLRRMADTPAGRGEKAKTTRGSKGTRASKAAKPSEAAS